METEKGEGGLVSAGGSGRGSLGEASGMLRAVASMGSGGFGQGRVNLGAAPGAVNVEWL